MDAWNEIQKLKDKKQEMKERLARRKRERQELVDSRVIKVAGTPPPIPVETSSNDSATVGDGAVRLETNAEAEPMKAPTHIIDTELLARVERPLLEILCDISTTFPVDTRTLIEQLTRTLSITLSRDVVHNLLEKFEAQQMISVVMEPDEQIDKVKVVESVEHKKLTALLAELQGNKSSTKRGHQSDSSNDEPETKKPKTQPESIEMLLTAVTAKDRENKMLNDEITEILSAPTAREEKVKMKFKNHSGLSVKEFCQNGTRLECSRCSSNGKACEKLHFKKLIYKHTDESLGDCSFLNTCFHMDSCKYVHYQIDYKEKSKQISVIKQGDGKKETEAVVLYPPQWIQCDVRQLDMTILGKFAVVMADPPWDIHMELPYGTMSDDEMRQFDVKSLSDDGYIFLWVTGRAMELGRECLNIWGYDRIDELIWVKTNQLQRLIRTGRTGHWINHGKEHCLVGVKGNPKNVNRGLDCDVIVSEVRETSRKPDEVYAIIERLSPGTRKIELFGRPHNVQPNWVTLGNQLDGVRLLEPDVVKAFKKKYPTGNCMNIKK